MYKIKNKTCYSMCVRTVCYKSSLSYVQNRFFNEKSKAKVADWDDQAGRSFMRKKRLKYGNE